LFLDEVEEGFLRVPRVPDLVVRYADASDRRDSGSRASIHWWKAESGFREQCVATCNANDVS
jgi:hypothetical protein